MKFFLLFIVATLFFQTGFAQNLPIPEKISVNIPIHQTHTTSDIADFINKHFDSDEIKIAAIYKWIISNIKYDADSIHYVILDEDNEQRVTFALRRKKGVCENFAAIFNDLCSKCGIKSFAIEGYTKQAGSIERRPHVWCAAWVNNEWNLYDPTWDVGFVRNGDFMNEVHYNYFKINPSTFIQTHLPFDPLFQFLNYPVKYKEFISGITKQDQKDYFNFIDSLNFYEKMSRLDQYSSSILRIRNTQWPSLKIDTKLKRIQFEIEVINQDSDMSLYNSAVFDYNRAIDYLNIFLTYRNNQLQPVKSISEVDEIFENVQKLITASMIKLKSINTSKATLVLDTGDLQKNLDDIGYKLKEQKQFFKNEISIAKETGFEHK